VGFFKKRLSIRGLIIFFSSLSVALLAIHHWIFHENGYWASFLLLHEIALMPLEFVVVTLGLEQILELTHKRENQAKISMIESVFFSESGSDMLRYLFSCDADKDIEEIRSIMDVQRDWSAKQIRQARAAVKNITYEVDSSKIDFFGLHYHLSTRHSYFLKVIENPALSGHERFTELLLHIYHLWEELECRTDLYNLPPDDREYLCKAVNAVYKELAIEWMQNATDLLLHQPERLHHVIRTNPFK
jgi:hypothetical protein